MNTVSSGSHEPLGGPPGSVLTSIDISRRSFLNIQTLYQKAMSHCLNEVKVSLLLIAEIIIVVCPWDKKGKFSKKSRLDLIFLVIRFRSRDYPERDWIAAMIG